MQVLVQKSLKKTLVHKLIICTKQQMYNLIRDRHL